jgi:hypothetical protein
LTVIDNYFHDSDGLGIWIIGGKHDTEFGQFLDFKIQRNRIQNVRTAIQIVDQVGGPGNNLMELKIEENIIDTNQYAVRTLRGWGYEPSTLLLDLGGGPMGSRGQNLFFNSVYGAWAALENSSPVYAENNYWGSPSGPSDGQPGVDADGIADPNGFGIPVAENIIWFPYLSHEP